MFFFLILISGVVLFYVFLFFPFSSASALILSSLLLIRNKRHLLIFPLILGFAYALLRYSPPLDTAFLSNRELAIKCVANSLEQETSSGRYVNKVCVESAVDARTGARLDVLNGREMNIISDEGLKQGWRYELTAKSGRDAERRNPGMMGGDTTFAYLEEIGNVETVKGNPLSAWLLVRRESLHRHLKSIFESDSAALLSSITIGETSGMSGELKTAFSTTGLAHLLSISGTHFGLFSMLVFGMFRLLMRSMPYRFLQRVTIFVTPPQAAAIISLPFIFIYLLISGASIPAVRSFIMINVFLLGLLIGRKGFWLNSLLLAAFLICLWDPSAVVSISFQLSFLAVLFIGFVVVERGKERGDVEVKVKDGRTLRSVTDSLLLTLSATLGTAPLVAYYFHYLSIISPLTNLIITPFVGFILVPLSLAAAFIFIFTGYYPFPELIAAVSDATVAGIRFIAAIPLADVKIPSFPVIALVVFYSGLLVYLLSGRKRYVLIVSLASLMICLSPLVRGGKGLSVTYLDVGQGDSAVVETSGGKIIVIDTGRTGKELERYLRYLGKKHIGVLAVTHADDDHAAGVPYIMKSFSVREVWDDGLLIYPEGLLKDVNHRSLERGDETSADGLSIYVLHPYKGFYTFADSEATAENNDSLVLKITGSNRSFLFAADTAEEGEEDMVGLRGWLKSDVLKVGHHGSRTSSTGEFIKAVSPEIGIVSVGRDNLYGHPHKDTLERLQGVRIYRTDRDGAIKVTETSTGLDVKTFREFGFERARSITGEWKNIKRLFARW